MHAMSRQPENIRKSILGGKERGRTPGISRYASSKIPKTSDSTRSFLSDFCMVNPGENKTIDLAMFDQFSTVPGSSNLKGGYGHLVKIANNETTYCADA